MKSDWNKDEPWIENDEFSKLIIDKSSILDIINKYGIEYSAFSSGSFKFKAKCPLPEHLGGAERTASFYFNEKSFWCFGCGSGNNIIDFVMLYKGMPYYKAMEVLSKLYGLSNVTSDELEKFSLGIKKIDPSHTLYPYIYHTGVIIREHLKSVNKNEYDRWNKWATDEFKKLDYFVDNYENDKWELVKENQEKIIRFIQNGKI